MKINGRETDVTCSDIKEIIEEHLELLPKNSEKEVAFFGGTFTGIDKRIQEGYLATVKPYIDRGLIDGIRLSTRPDYINEKILDLLLKYGVTTIELGVQSLDDEVLAKSERGYKSNIVEAASTLIKSYGFKLGIQIMPGLPGSSNKTDYETAEKVLKIKPDIINPELPACHQGHPANMHDSNIPEKEAKNSALSKEKAWNLFAEYLTLRQKQKKTDEELSIISDKMEKLFDSDENNTVETMIGAITRTEDHNGNRRWILEVSGA